MTDFLNQLTESDAPDMRDVGASAALVGGKGFCRLVGVIVLGKQPGAFNNKPKPREEIRLIYELYAKQWPASEDGKPPLKSETLTYSMNDRARMRKRWADMDPDGRTRNLFQLINRPFLITLKEKKSGKGRTFVLVEAVEEATYQNPATGEKIDYRDGNSQGNRVPGPVHPVMAFNYDVPSIEQWNSLFLPGFRDDGSSMNAAQNTVRRAIGFDSSPMASILRAMGRDVWTDYDAHGQIIPGSRDANIRHVAEWTAYRMGTGPMPGSGEGPTNSPQEAAPATTYGQNALASQTGHAPPPMPEVSSVASMAAPPAASPSAPPPFTPPAGTMMPPSAPPSPAGTMMPPSAPPSPGSAAPYNQALDDEIPF